MSHVLEIGVLIHMFFRLQRLIVTGFHCDLGTKDCLGNMTAMFRDWKKDPMTTRYNECLEIKKKEFNDQTAVVILYSL
jgi:hypothetical protein